MAIAYRHVPDPVQEEETLAVDPPIRRRALKSAVATYVTGLDHVEGAAWGVQDNGDDRSVKAINYTSVKDALFGRVPPPSRLEIELGEDSLTDEVTVRYCAPTGSRKGIDAAQAVMDEIEDRLNTDFTRSFYRE